MPTTVLVELVPVAIDDPRLGRLLQLYQHEWSAVVATPIGDDALFTYAELPLYRDRDARAAYLFIDADNGRTPLGFALVMRDDTACWHVEEFFIVAGARRRGRGAVAARRLFIEHPGRWTFTVRPENPGALAFWRRIVGDADERVEVGSDGVVRRRLSFVA